METIDNKVKGIVEYNGELITWECPYCQEVHYEQDINIKRKQKLFHCDCYNKVLVYWNK